MSPEEIYEGMCSVIINGHGRSLLSALTETSGHHKQDIRTMAMAIGLSVLRAEPGFIYHGTHGVYLKDGTPTRINVADYRKKQNEKQPAAVGGAA